MDKETHVANLIQLSKVDGQVSPHEIIFIQSLALRMGVDGDTFQRIVKYPDKVPFRIAKDEADRRRQLCELIVLAQIDQDKDMEELNLIEHMGAQLGFSVGLVDKLVSYFAHNPIPQDLEALFDSM